MVSSPLDLLVFPRPADTIRVNGLLFSAISLCLVLLLFMPLVVTPWTFAPSMFGKALYARGLILIIVALWLTLWQRDRTYHIPRSWVLSVLAIYVAFVFLSGLTGVSPAQSFLSNYSRMTGVFDLVLWFLLTVVVVSVLRSPTAWRTLLNWSLIVGFIACLLALVEMSPIQTGYLAQACRLDGTLGNPSYLAAILVVTTLVATGLLVSSLLPSDHQNGRQETVSPGRWPLLGWQLFWLVAAALSIWVLFLTGTRAALVGLVAGGVAMTLALAIWGNRRALLPMVLATAGLFLFIAFLFLVGETVGLPQKSRCGSSVVTRVAKLVASTSAEGNTGPKAILGIRGAFAGIGIGAFLDRPALGWGHGNFGAAYDRHAQASIYRYSSGRGDNPHNQPIEELATHGIVGTLAFVALWLALVWGVVRRRRPPREEVVAYAVLGALAGYFVQNIFLFHTPAAMLYWIMLVAWVAGQESAPEVSAQPVPAPERIRPMSLKGRPILLSIALVLALGFSGYYLIYLPYSANRTFVKAFRGSYPLTETLALASDSFSTLPGMSNQPKEVMFIRLLEVRDDLTPEQKREVAAFVFNETMRTLDRDSSNVGVVTAGVAILQRSASPEGLKRLDPLIQHLQQHAPERHSTYVLAAIQESLKGNHRGAIRLAEEFEALTPYVPQGIRDVKQVAENSLNDEGR